MKTLTGRITCSVEGKTINPNAKIEIQIRDVSIMDRASKLLHGIELTGKTEFPIDFKMEFDDTKIRENPHFDFALSVRIETDGKLDYITDTRFDVTKGRGSGVVLDHIDLFVIPVVPYNP